MKNEALLIGATGFAGQAILPHLSKKYDHVHILARRECDFSHLDNVSVYVSNLDNEKLIDSLAEQCKTILYFAWDSTPGKTALNPNFELSENLSPLIRFLEILQKHKDIHLLFLSSAGTIYGNSDSTPIDENQPFFPRSYYAASKISGEAFITAFGRQTGSQITILRPTNFYGVGQPYVKGFGLIRTIFEHVINDTSIEIWGDGNAKRDFLYIDDFVSACLLLLNQNSMPAVQIYNISSGFTASINEICDLIEAISGRKIKKVYSPSRSVDLRYISIDSSKLKSIGWTSNTTLSQGLTFTWEWLCKTRSHLLKKGH